MTRRSKRTVAFIAAVFALTLIANMEVATLRGVDYKIYVIKMPLYLKALDFFDRHYNYRLLTKRIIGPARTDEEKVSRLLDWTHANIRRAPKGLPIVDDHVWHIIVRGYGAHDQSADVFTALCNYAGLEAFFAKIYGKDRSSRMSLSFVKVGKRWTVFDPYYDVYFKNSSGGLASIEEIRTGEWTMVSSGESVPDYKPFLDNLPIIKKAGLRRSTIQSPLNRLLFAIKKMWLGKRYDVQESDYER